MTKAKIPTHEERLEATRRKMAKAREAKEHKQEAEKHRRLSAYLKAREKMRQEHPEYFTDIDEYHCPVCGEELIKMFME